MMFKAIIWDMDGTIVDTERVVWDVMRHAFKDAKDIELAEDEFDSLLGQSEVDFYHHMLKRYQLNDEDVASIRQVFDNSYIPKLKQIPALPGAIEKVREFKQRASQALVTGSTGAQAAAVIENLELDGNFEFVLSCDDYSKGKPDPEPFLMAAKKMNVDPSSCLVLEDSPSGVTAAKAAGMKVVGIHEGNQGKYDIAHADLEVPSLTDLNWDKLVAHFS